MLLITVITVRTVSKMSGIQCFRPTWLCTGARREAAEPAYVLFPKCGMCTQRNKRAQAQASPSYSSHHSIRELIQQLSDEDQEHLDMAISTLTRHWHWLKSQLCVIDFVTVICYIFPLRLVFHLYCDIKFLDLKNRDIVSYP